MNFSELLLKRESVRRYSKKPVAMEDIEQTVEACRLAPTACNSQPWRFVVVADPELKNWQQHQRQGLLSYGYRRYS